MNEINFTPYPTLKTDRLLLRAINMEDDNEIFFMRSDEGMNKYIARDLAKEMSEAHAFIEKINTGIENNSWMFWGIQLIDNPTLIGTMSLWNFTKEKYVAEVGYNLMPDFQGRGLMDETLKEVINYGFDTLQLTEIEAYTQKGNLPSRKLLENNNFVWDENRKDEGFPLNLIYVLKA